METALPKAGVGPGDGRLESGTAHSGQGGEAREVGLGTRMKCCVGCRKEVGFYCEHNWEPLV